MIKDLNMSCCICNKYLMCVAVRRRYTEDPIVQNLDKCGLTKVFGYQKICFLCDDCISAIEKCAERMELMQNKRVLFRSEPKGSDVLRCLVCSTYDRVQPFKISEADSKNYIINELVGHFPKFDGLSHACRSCTSLISQLDRIIQSFFLTEAEFFSN